MSQQIKLFQMHLINGINDQAAPFRITEREFRDFCSRHREFGRVTVAEPAGSMENSYLMINPKGELQINNGGHYCTYGSCYTAALSSLMEKLPLDKNKISARYVKEDIA